MIYRRNGLQGFGQPFAPSQHQPFFPSYRLTGPIAQPMSGFGLNFSINTPVGKQNFSIPVEELAQQAAKAAVDAAWPIVEQKFYEELPKAVDAALDRAQPRVRAEVDRAVALATSRAAMIASALAVVMIGTAWWTRRAVVKGR